MILIFFKALGSSDTIIEQHWQFLHVLKRSHVTQTIFVKGELGTETKIIGNI